MSPPYTRTRFAIEMINAYFEMTQDRRYLALLLEEARKTDQD